MNFQASTELLETHVSSKSTPEHGRLRGHPSSPFPVRPLSNKQEVSYIRSVILPGLTGHPPQTIIRLIAILFVEHRRGSK